MCVTRIKHHVCGHEKEKTLKCNIHLNAPIRNEKTLCGKIKQLLDTRCPHEVYHRGSERPCFECRLANSRQARTLKEDLGEQLEKKKASFMCSRCKKSGHQAEEKYRYVNLGLCCANGQDEFRERYGVEKLSAPMRWSRERVKSDYRRLLNARPVSTVREVADFPDPGRLKATASDQKPVSSATMMARLDAVRAAEGYGWQRGEAKGESDLDPQLVAHFVNIVGNSADLLPKPLPTPQSSFEIYCEPQMPQIPRPAATISSISKGRSSPPAQSSRDAAAKLASPRSSRKLAESRSSSSRKINQSSRQIPSAKPTVWKNSRRPSTQPVRLPTPTALASRKSTTTSKLSSKKCTEYDSTRPSRKAVQVSEITTTSSSRGATSSPIKACSKPVTGPTLTMPSRKPVTITKPLPEKPLPAPPFKSTVSALSSSLRKEVSVLRSRPRADSPLINADDQPRILTDQTPVAIRWPEFGSPVDSGSTRSSLETDHTGGREALSIKPNAERQTKGRLAKPTARSGPAAKTSKFEGRHLDQSAPKLQRRAIGSAGKAENQDCHDEAVRSHTLAGHVDRASPEVPYLCQPTPHRPSEHPQRHRPIPQARPAHPSPSRLAGPASSSRRWLLVESNRFHGKSLRTVKATQIDGPRAAVARPSRVTPDKRPEIKGGMSALSLDIRDTMNYVENWI